MALIQKILVPTDFSAGAESALRLACDLSGRFAAPVTLVYVFEPLDYPLPNAYAAFLPEQFDRLVAHFNERLGRAERNALDAGASSVSTRVLNGWAPDEIVRFAKEGEFGLIVMGTHGRSGLKHLLIGSVAERVVRTAPCPVLTVRERDTA